MSQAGLLPSLTAVLAVAGKLPAPSADDPDANLGWYEAAKAGFVPVDMSRGPLLVPVNPYLVMSTVGSNNKLQVPVYTPYWLYALIELFTLRVPEFVRDDWPLPPTNYAARFHLALTQKMRCPEHIWAEAADICLERYRRYL